MHLRHAILLERYSEPLRPDSHLRLKSGQSIRRRVPVFSRTPLYLLIRPLLPYLPECCVSILLCPSHGVLPVVLWYRAKYRKGPIAENANVGSFSQDFAVAGWVVVLFLLHLHFKECV